MHSMKHVYVESRRSATEGMSPMMNACNQSDTLTKMITTRRSTFQGTLFIWKITDVLKQRSRGLHQMAKEIEEDQEQHGGGPLKMI